jgi:threonine synthase
MVGELRYGSTRGLAPECGFADVLMTGLAADGGLYCPLEVPPLPEVDPASPYAAVAVEVMWPFVAGAVERDTFASLVADAYAGFRHEAVCPVRELDQGHWLLELFWGPTLAFKDVALQVVARLLDHELGRRGERATVIGATSGDTGSAAIEALRGRRNVDVVILHPRGRVSEVQRRQMTTVDDPNVHNLAVEGTFDDCQDLVKALFSDEALRAELNLVAVNSINWARIMAQIVYYVTAARAVRPGGGPVAFSVPTGNFGNVLAGWYAHRMGLAVDRLVVASNRNDILTRFLATGRLQREPVVASLSPSMDIGVSSNLERLLWEVSGRDGGAVADLVARFRAEGAAEVPPAWMGAIERRFDGVRADDEGTLAVMGQVHRELGLLVDPHTAVGLHAATEARRDPAVPMITLATAHPAKFPDAVERATGVRPPLPPFLAELLGRAERYDVVANDPAALAAHVRSLVFP